MIGRVSFPIVQQALAEREVQKNNAMYATGHSPYEFHSGDVDALVQEHLTAALSVSITAGPSFPDTVAIRLVGQDLYCFVLDFPLYEAGEKQRPEFNSKGIPKTHASRVSAEANY